MKPCKGGTIGRCLIVSPLQGLNLEQSDPFFTQGCDHFVILPWALMSRPVGAWIQPNDGCGIVVASRWLVGLTPVTECLDYFARSLISRCELTNALQTRLNADAIQFATMILPMNLQLHFSSHPRIFSAITSALVNFRPFS